MGEKTGIDWTDHTFNPWIGCTKVSAGCENCYAERQNNFYHWNPEGWGPGKPRRMTSDDNWKKPIRWAKQAVKDGVTRRVFCASLADVFDTEVNENWRLFLFELIEECAQIGGLEWLILTKRPENIRRATPATWFRYPLKHIRIGVTAEDQANADRRIPELLQAWKGRNFVSVEPMLGPVDLSGINGALSSWKNNSGIDCVESGHLDWVICGSESGSGARPFSLDWARGLRDQCVAAGVPFFFKQATINGRLVKMPELDGKVWDQFPEEK